jgi:DnaK suppressor protein
MSRKLDDLAQELESVQSQIETLEKAIEAEPDFGLGEGDPAITQREVDRALLESLNQRAETLQRAISEIERGTYGKCQRCGNPIHPDRLAVLPETKLCIQCAQNGT